VLWYGFFDLPGLAEVRLQRLWLLHVNASSQAAPEQDATTAGICTWERQGQHTSWLFLFASFV
jgi:hypothetical protein